MSDSKQWPKCPRCGKAIPPETVAHACKPKQNEDYKLFSEEKFQEIMGSFEARTKPD